LARKKNPFGPNSLDALCARFGIDNSRRTKHGALLDAEILAEVYLEMMGGRQTGLDLAAEIVVAGVATDALGGSISRARPVALPSRLTTAEMAAHAAFVASLGDQAVWKNYIADEAAE
jgi:DNA polymerase-3 subunit epsilon